MPTYVTENIRSPWEAKTNSSAQKSAYYLKGTSKAFDRCM